MGGAVTPVDALQNMAVNVRTVRWACNSQRSEPPSSVLRKMFALFRDEILPTGLRFGHVRSELEAGLSTLQERHMKRVVCRADGLPSARSIEGWEFVRA